MTLVIFSAQLTIYASGGAPCHALAPCGLHVPVQVHRGLPGQAPGPRAPAPRPRAPHDAPREAVSPLLPRPRVRGHHQRRARVSEAAALTLLAAPAEHLAPAVVTDAGLAHRLARHGEADHLQRGRRGAARAVRVVLWVRAVHQAPA